ncbi:MAG: hypothetical protein M3299_12365 [Thermoproteota archaeon]|nr:hypothetical protein [Thermoproteota archaeon]
MTSSLEYTLVQADEEFLDFQFNNPLGILNWYFVTIHSEFQCCKGKVSLDSKKI